MKLSEILRNVAAMRNTLGPESRSSGYRCRKDRTKGIGDLRRVPLRKTAARGAIFDLIHFMYFSNHARSHSILARRNDSKPRPCG